MNNAGDSPPRTRPGAPSENMPHAPPSPAEDAPTSIVRHDDSTSVGGLLAQVLLLEPAQQFELYQQLGAHLMRPRAARQ